MSILCDLFALLVEKASLGNELCMEGWVARDLGIEQAVTKRLGHPFTNAIL